MSERNNGEMILVFLLGGALGAYLGTRFALQSGKETKKKVKIFFDGIGEKTGELIEEGKEKIEKFVNRGVSNVFPNKLELESVLRSGKKLTIYHGIDPTGELHIGHLVSLRKLAQAQQAGHEIIVLIGDFTARIGDPTDKLAARKQLSEEQVEHNAKNYKELIGKIIDTSHANMRFLHNEEWSNKLKPADLLELASHFTVQQLIERDMFQQRLKNGKEIYLSEFLYPVFQAYDSVTMDVDMEVGGNDQTFNMLAGRNLMKKMMGKEKFVLAMKLLTDPQGKKMGKTEGNVINLDDSSENIFGKVMSFSDELIEVGFELLTDIDLLEAKKMTTDNPRDAKATLAYEVVKQLTSESEAAAARENFDKVFSRGEVPEHIGEISTSNRELLDILVESGFAASKSEARRLVEQGAVRVDSETIKDPFCKMEKSEFVLSSGKRNYTKVKIDD